MRKVVFTITCLLLLGLITGCGCSREAERPKNEKEIVKYAKDQQYGEAKVSETVTKTDDYAEYILKDVEYGFTYTCKSYVDEFRVDGAGFGLYSDVTNCEFDEPYRKYIYATLGIEDLVSGYYPGHFTFYFESEEDAMERLPKIVTQIQQIDKNRQYFVKHSGKYGSNDHSQILVYDKEKHYFGSVDIPTGKYQNKYEEQIENRKRDFAIAVYGIRSGTAASEEGITYLYYKQVQYKDVEGLNLEWLDNSKITGDDWTTAYYFDFDGKTYFIIGATVNVPASEALRSDYGLNYKERGYYNRSYTNYIFAD